METNRISIASNKFGTPDDPYTDLAVSIVENAIIDFKNYYMELRMCRGYIGDKTKLSDKCEQCIKFFNSDLCQMLSPMEGKDIVYHCINEVDKVLATNAKPPKFKVLADRREPESILRDDWNEIIQSKLDEYHLSVNAFASLIQMSQSGVQYMVKGDRVPRRKTLEKVADFFNISVESFYV